MPTLIIRWLFLASIPCALAGVGIILYVSVSYGTSKGISVNPSLLSRLDRLPNTPGMNRTIVFSLWSLALLLVSGGLLMLLRGDRSDPSIPLVAMGVLLFASSAIVVGPLNGRPWTAVQRRKMNDGGSMMVTHVPPRSQRVRRLAWIAGIVLILAMAIAWMWPLS